MNRNIGTITVQGYAVDKSKRKFSDREKTVIFWCLLYLVGDSIVALLFPAGCKWVPLYVLGAVISAIGAFVVFVGWIRLPGDAKGKNIRKAD